MAAAMETKDYASMLSRARATQCDNQVAAVVARIDREICAAAALGIGSTALQYATLKLDDSSCRIEPKGTAEILRERVKATFKGKLAFKECRVNGDDYDHTTREGWQINIILPATVVCPPGGTPVSTNAAS
jgi:hypothetical protein